MTAGHGCFYCKRHGEGFARDRAAFVYVAKHAQWHALKIGVAGVDSSRLQHLTSQGWEIAYRHRVPTGSHALEVERQVLDHVRVTLGSGPYLSREQMPRGGHTETIDPDAVSVTALVERVKAATRDV